ncbi:uncharacterized protein [Clytia hemisphaerica]|uniref:ZP domain-containing protein n=1 Tax=Clytia hemisphaerica TaxID=252671 RepID=A0A7M5VAS1_9CNID
MGWFLVLLCTMLVHHHQVKSAYPNLSAESISSSFSELQRRPTSITEFPSLAATSMKSLQVTSSIQSMISISVLPTPSSAIDLPSSSSIYVQPENCTGFSIPCGPQFGDQFVQAGDDVATCFSSFSKKFPLFSRVNRSKICICSNGYITLDKLQNSFRKSLTSGYPSVLIPFNYDMISLGNNILYRTTKDQNILNLVDRDISLSKSVSSFKSKEAIVVTFNNVPHYGNRNMIFRYQVVIATDYKNTYTIFNYDRMDNSGYDNIGYAEPDGEVSCTPYKRFNLNGHTLTTSSNVGKPGKFIFLLTNCTNDRVLPTTTPLLTTTPAARTNSSEKMVKLECHSNGFEAGFNLKRLSATMVPYSIRFSGNNNCSSVDKTSVGQIRNGRLWIGSNYTQCGIQTSYSGDNIIFEQKLIVSYGSKNQPRLVYRSPTRYSYRFKCILNRNINSKLNMDVEDKFQDIEEINGTSNFQLELKMTRPDSDKEQQMVTIGDRLRFTLNLPNAPQNVKTSPQNCYTTRIDGSGRYNLISNRCVSPNVKETTVITSLATSLHQFSWELSAFRYFGDSNTVVIVCEVLVCKNDAFWRLSEECKRCGQTSNRRKRRENEEEENQSVVLQKRTVSSEPIYIIEKSQRQEQKVRQKDNGAIPKPTGIAIIAILATIVLVVGAVLVKKRL